MEYITLPFTTVSSTFYYLLDTKAKLSILSYLSYYFKEIKSGISLVLMFPLKVKKNLLVYSQSVLLVY